MAKRRGSVSGVLAGEGTPAGADLNRGRNSALGGSFAVHKTKVERLEALLREALVWCPRRPTHPPSGKIQAKGRGWVDLGNRIDAELGLDVVTERNDK